jgi:hypothetical protein
MKTLAIAVLLRMAAPVAWFVHKRCSEARLRQWADQLRAEIEQAGGVEAWKRLKAEERSRDP